MFSNHRLDSFDVGNENVSFSDRPCGFTLDQYGPHDGSDCQGHRNGTGCRPPR
jgi:hypothetical protein